jgi:hypothetical protein
LIYILLSGATALTRYVPAAWPPAKEDKWLPTRSSETSSMALLQSLKESILSQASAKAIYGEPVSAHGKTVIPVAKIMYG